MRKFFFLLSPFVLFFFLNIRVSATENNFDFNNTYYPFGLSSDELKEFEYSTNHWIVPFPTDIHFFDFSSDLDYTIDETISLGGSGLSYNTYSSLYGSTSGNVPFGSAVSFSGGSGYVQVTMYNNGEPLFDEPGTFNIQMYCGGDFTKVMYYFLDGTSYVRTYDPPGSTVADFFYYCEFQIDNPNADLYKVVCYEEAGNPCSMNVVKYGYVFPDEPEDPEEPEEPLPTVPGDTSGVFNFLLNFMSQYIESLFLLEIVSGVSFGYFILACAILGVIFGFFFSKMIK